MATLWIKKGQQEKGTKDNWKEKLPGTETRLPFSLWQNHMDSPAVSSPSVTYLSALGHKAHLCSCHPLKMLESPVLNLHLSSKNGWKSLTHSSHPRHARPYIQQPVGSQAGTYIFFPAFLKTMESILQLLFLISLLKTLLPLISVLRILSKHNTRPAITISHWFMWHCSIFYTVLFFAIFNNLLALLATAIKAWLSGRVLHHVYCRFNCSI